MALNPTTTTSGTTEVTFNNVKFDKQDGLKETETQYLIREGATWKVGIDKTNLNSDIDALMGITYKLLDEDEERGTTTSGDSNIVYDKTNDCYIISSNVVYMKPVVRTPLAIEVISKDVTMTSVEDKIVKGGVGTIYLYAGEWTLVFGSSDKPSSASEAALKAFGKGSSSWTISQDNNISYTVTIELTATVGEFKMKITKN